MTRRAPATWIPTSPLLAALLLLTWGGVGGCGPAEEAPEPGDLVRRGDEPARGGTVQRSRDPRVVALREAIEFGRLDLARTLFGQVGELAGTEGPLLAARLALLEGDALAALKGVEEARRRDPDDRRVYGTAAEIYANLGRFASARDELAAGLRAAGSGPELDRATGVIYLLQPGGARQGLEALERARGADPELPFLARPLSQAHILVASRRLADGDPEDALEHALQARALDPGEVDAIDLEAECRAALFEFERAFELYAELESFGVDVADRRAHLHKSAATFHVNFGDRAAAIEHYVAARAQGLDDAALGFGATFLRDRAVERIDRGIEAYGAGDLAGARAAFEEALAIDTTCLEAANHLGVVAFREGDYRGAAARWEDVWEQVLAEVAEPAEPVHLNLARAWRMAGEPARARAVLEAYLARDPDGPWGAESREALRRLEAETNPGEPEAGGPGGPGGPGD